MAWTPPVDQNTGTLITAAIYNAQIIDNLNELRAPVIVTGSVANGGTYAPDVSAGRFFAITMTGATMTFNAPLNPPSSTNGMAMFIQVKNGSGAGLSSIGFAAVYKMAGPSPALPANNLAIMYELLWNGASWVQVGGTDTTYTP